MPAKGVFPPKRRIGTCVYCSNKGPISKDHVPPKLLFPEPRPSLITVRSCDRCRDSTHKDDEYFLHALSRRADVRAHPSMQALLPSIERALQYPKAQQFAERLGRETSFRPEIMPDGSLVHFQDFEPHPPQIGRVVERITRGLYFRETGRGVPIGYQITMVAEHLLPGIMDIYQRVQIAQPRRELGAGEFSYQWILGRASPEMPEVSTWLLTFYMAVPFVMLVTPMDQPQNWWLEDPPTQAT